MSILVSPNHSPPKVHGFHLDALPEFGPVSLVIFWDQKVANLFMLWTNMAEDDYDPLRKRTTVRSHQGDVLRSRRQRQIRQMLNEGSGEMDSVVSSASLRSMCGEWPASEDFWRLPTFACCGVVGFFLARKGCFLSPCCTLSFPALVFPLGAVLWTTSEPDFRSHAWGVSKCKLCDPF